MNYRPFLESFYLFLCMVSDKKTQFAILVAVGIECFSFVRFLFSVCLAGDKKKINLLRVLQCACFRFVVTSAPSSASAPLLFWSLPQALELETFNGKNLVTKVR